MKVMSSRKLECTLSMTESTNTHKCSYIYIANTFNVFEECFYNFYFIDCELNI